MQGLELTGWSWGLGMAGAPPEISTKQAQLRGSQSEILEDGPTPTTFYSHPHTQFSKPHRNKVWAGESREYEGRVTLFRESDWLLAEAALAKGNLRVSQPSARQTSELWRNWWEPSLFLRKVACILVWWGLRQDTHRSALHFLPCVSVSSIRA